MFQWTVNLVVFVLVLPEFVPIEWLAYKAKFHAEVFFFFFILVVFIIPFNPKCCHVIKFGIFVIMRVKSTIINTGVTRHDSALPCFRAFLGENRGQGK